MVVRIDYHCNNEILEWQWSSDNELMSTPFFTSCYLIDGLLIDSGAPGGVDDLREFVNSLTPDEMIEKCFITHTHEDHAGGANLLNTEFEIPIYASKEAIDLLVKAHEKYVKVGSTTQTEKVKLLLEDLTEQVKIRPSEFGV